MANDTRGARPFRRSLPDAALFADLFPASASTRLRRRRRASRGQSLVEFALLTPVLVMILALAADFGRAFTAYIAISSAAREGASYGSDSSTQATSSSGISAAALADAPTIWGAAPSVSSTTGTDAYGYTYVQVTVNYTFSPLTQVPPIPASIAMTRVVRMRVIN
jgi:Flp pilus assembly protein TadG